MKEREINFTRNDDPTLVVDKDGAIAKKLAKVYDGINLNLGFCFEQLKKGKLTEGMKETHLSLTESYVQDFLKAMDYDSIIQKDKDERFKEIRAVNEENRELRKQLGEKVSNEDVREKLKSLEKSIESWWNINSFGHTSKINFMGHGAEIEFSGMVSESYHNRKNKDKEQTEEDKIEYLKKLGFEIEDSFVVSNDKSLELIDKMLTDKYPSTKIISTTTNNRKNESVFRKINVIIYDLNDIK